MRFALIGMLAWAGSALAQEGTAGVYKWTDANGGVHYDDTNLLQPRLTQDILNERRISAAASTLQGSAPPEYRKDVARRCELMRERLGDYRSAQALYARDPSGNVYPLSPNQVALTLAGMQRDTSTLCASGAADRLYAASMASSNGRKTAQR